MVPVNQLLRGIEATEYGLTKTREIHRYEKLVLKVLKDYCLIYQFWLLKASKVISLTCKKDTENSFYSMFPRSAKKL